MGTAKILCRPLRLPDVSLKEAPPRRVSRRFLHTVYREKGPLTEDLSIGRNVSKVHPQDKFKGL